MPVRLRITLLFTFIVFVILGIVCMAVYYVTYTERINLIKNRLTNRTITTARLLSQSTHFTPQLIQKIDSSTAISLTNKTVQAYDYLNNQFYSFSDKITDTLNVNQEILDNARVQGIVYFTAGDRDVLAYHHTDENNRMVLVSAAYDETGQKNVKDLFYILLLSFIGGVLIAFISGWIFSRELLQPLQKISNEVNDISAHSLTQRINSGNTRDEWYALTETFNQLLNRLQESFETQQRFIANASHELLTPLTAISSQLEVSLQKERGKEEYSNVMRSVYQDVRQLSKLTQTLLEFAKASGSPAGLEIGPLRIDEILLLLPSEIAKINKAYSVSLHFDELPEEESELIVLGNSELLFTAIRNIVLNACKYSANGEAIVHLSIEKQIAILIKNYGAGIPATQLKTIFEPFYRLEETRQTEGFGLGLSLATRIIKLHKGTITVDSEVGLETTFTIRLISSQKI